MHLLVLSAFRLYAGYLARNKRFVSQCTFWCSVLSDRDDVVAIGEVSPSLNAPFGAQCFPTVLARYALVGGSYVSMHLLVLSAFRPEAHASSPWTASRVSMHLLVLSAFRRGCHGVGRDAEVRLNAPFGAQCFPTSESRGQSSSTSVSMHLLVLSAFRPGRRLRPRRLGHRRSQCTFWCSVLSDPSVCTPAQRTHSVSMHLLVLSAFRHREVPQEGVLFVGLNAPFGAQCFPTKRVDGGTLIRWVSMHLLVLSAFRRTGEGDELPDGS